MSLIYCNIHAHWDSDFHEECPYCLEAMNTPKPVAETPTPESNEFFDDVIQEHEPCYEKACSLERRLSEALRERDELMAALHDIDIRAQRITEVKACVGVEAGFIRHVIMRAIESTKNPKAEGG